MADGDRLEFRMLGFKRLDSEYVTFELEDGAVVRIKVDLERVGKAVGHTNPDGTPHYAISTTANASVVPPDRKFTMARQPARGGRQPPGQMFS